MFLVTLDRDLSGDELREGKALAKESRGWWDREKGGFMMRDPKSAYELGEKLGKPAEVRNEENEPVTPLTDEEVASVIDAMKAHATVAPTIEITDANWKENIETPIGNVKMGAYQKEKLLAKGRESQYGMLVETLSNPDIVLEEKDKTENLFHERPSSYLFIKTFQKSDGSKHIHFESVTVSQEGLEISVSSHIIREQALEKKLKNSNVIYKIETLFPNSSEMHLAEHQNDVSDLLPTQGNNVSASKVTNNSTTAQTKSRKTAKH